MQILGLGLPPDRVRSLVCAPLPADPGALLLSWEPPAFPGEPVYSRITVEEFFPGGSAASWEAALTLGPGETSVVVPPRPRATFGSGRAFRVTLWSEGGPSAWVKVDGCRPIEAGGEEGGAGKRRGGGAAGGAGVGGGAGAEGGVVPDSAVQEAAAWWTVGEGLAGTLAALSGERRSHSLTSRALFLYCGCCTALCVTVSPGSWAAEAIVRPDQTRPPLALRSGGGAAEHDHPRTLLLHGPPQDVCPRRGCRAIWAPERPQDGLVTKRGRLAQAPPPAEVRGQRCDLPQAMYRSSCASRAHPWALVRRVVRGYRKELCGQCVALPAPLTPAFQWHEGPPVLSTLSGAGRSWHGPSRRQRQWGGGAAGAEATRAARAAKVRTLLSTAHRCAMNWTPLMLPTAPSS